MEKHVQLEQLGGQVTQCPHCHGSAILAQTPNHRSPQAEIVSCLSCGRTYNSGQPAKVSLATAEQRKERAEAFLRLKESVSKTPPAESTPSSPKSDAFNELFGT